MNQQTNIAVFASGSGSNFEAMLREETLLDKIRILICDKPGAPVIERAERYRVPVLVLQPSDFKDKATYEQHILTRLKERSEEHTSELQSRFDIVCRLLLEKKKTS